MAVYTVHQPGAEAERVSSDPERFVFVRDGFSFWAFLLPPLWMLRHRLWLAFAAYAVAITTVEAALRVLGAPPWARIAAAVLLSLLIGLEAATLRRLKLARRGFSNVGLVTGDS